MRESIDNFFHSEQFVSIALFLSVGVIALIVTVLLIKLFFSLKKKAINSLVYKREFSDDGIYEGDEVTLIETIFNPTFFPLIFLNVGAYYFSELEFVNSRNKKTEPVYGEMIFSGEKFNLLPYMQIVRRHKIKCTKRGVYKLQNVSIFSGNINKNASSTAELYVFPKLIEKYELTPPMSFIQGDVVSKRRLIEDNFSFGGIRDYLPSDPFSSINFKATAKYGYFSNSSIKVNARDYCSGRNIFIIINFHTDIDSHIESDVHDRMFEYALSFTCSTVNDAILSGYRTGFASNCTDYEESRHIIFDISSGESHMLDILKALAGIRMAEGASIASVLNNDKIAGITNSDIIFISQYFDEETDRLTSHFKTDGNTFTHIKLDEKLFM